MAEQGYTTELLCYTPHETPERQQRKRKLLDAFYETYEKLFPLNEFGTPKEAFEKDIFRYSAKSAPGCIAVTGKDFDTDHPKVYAFATGRLYTCEQNITKHKPLTPTSPRWVKRDGHAVYKRRFTVGMREYLGTISAINGDTAGTRVSTEAVKAARDKWFLKESHRKRLKNAFQISEVRIPTDEVIKTDTMNPWKRIELRLREGGEIAAISYYQPPLHKDGKPVEMSLVIHPSLELDQAERPTPQKLYSFLCEHYEQEGMDLGKSPHFMEQVMQLLSQKFNKPRELGDGWSRVLKASQSSYYLQKRLEEAELARKAHQEAVTKAVQAKQH